MNDIASLRSAQICVVAAPAEYATHALLMITARLAITRPVLVVDGGNRFNAYTVARRIRRTQTEVSTCLRRIQVARAFTCQQLLVILESTPADTRPKMVLDLLDAFRDNDLYAAERAHIFQQCLGHVRRISRTAPVFLSVRLSASGRPEDQARWQALQAAADQVLTSVPFAAPLPAKLF